MNRASGKGLLVFGIVLAVVGTIMRFAAKVHTKGFNIHEAGAFYLSSGSRSPLWVWSCSSSAAGTEM